MPSSKNIIAHVTADLAKGTVNVQQINCTQYDAEAKVIAVHMKENGSPWEIPAGYSVNIRMKKVDGTVVYDPGEAEGDTAYITLSGQMCLLPGEQIFVVELVQGSSVVQTAPIRLRVIQNPMQEGDEISEDEKETIQGLVEQAQAAAQEAADAAQKVVDENLEDYLKKSGGTMQSDINMGNYNIGHIARLFGSSNNTNYIQFLVQGCGGTVTKIYGTSYDGKSQSVAVGNGGVDFNSTGPVNLNTGEGTITANNKRIQDVASPTASSDAATKGYVDEAVAGIESIKTLTNARTIDAMVQSQQQQIEELKTRLSALEATTCP